MDDLTKEVRSLVVEALRLEMTAEEIAVDAPLFGDDGLGLDSLDVLELAVALEYRYGFKMELDAEEGRRVFSSMTSLAEFVGSKRTA